MQNRSPPPDIGYRIPGLSGGPTGYRIPVFKILRLISWGEGGWGGGNSWAPTGYRIILFENHFSRRRFKTRYIFPKLTNTGYSGIGYQWPVNAASCKATVCHAVPQIYSMQIARQLSRPKNGPHRQDVAVRVFDQLRLSHSGRSLPTAWKDVSYDAIDHP